MAGLPAMRKGRGAVTGMLLILLGLWGGLVPFVGPYFHYAYTPDAAWHLTLGRLWLEIVPATAVAAGGALVVAGTGRLAAVGGAILAVLAGGWFVAGTVLNAVWPHLGTPGVPAGTSAIRRALEELGLFTGLGAVIVFCAALALGRAFAPAPRATPSTEPDTEAGAEPDTEAGTVAGGVPAGQS